MQRLGRGLLVAILATLLAGGALAPSSTQAAHPAWHPRQPLLQWSPVSAGRTVRRGDRHVLTIRTWYRTAHTIHNAVFVVHPGAGLSTPTPVIVRATVTPYAWHLLSFDVVVPALAALGAHRGTVRLLGDADHDGDVDGLGTPFTVVVRVVRAAPSPRPLITWMPARLGTLTVHRGQTVTAVVRVTSNVNLTNVQVLSGLSGLSGSHLHMAIAPATLPAMAAHTPVQVTFTLSADAAAAMALQRADLHVVASFNGGPAVRRARDLDFSVDVDRAPPPPRATISWTPTGLGTLTVRRGQTITETASFVSNLSLTSVQLHNALPLPHVAIVIVSPIPASVAAHTPVQVTFTVSADAAAPIRVRSTYLYLTGSTSGGPVMTLHRGLHFTVDVDAAAAAMVTWPSGSPVTYPTIAITRGGSAASAAESGTFMATMALSKVTFVAAVSGPAPRAVAVAVAPLANPSVAAHTPTGITFTINVLPTAKQGYYRGVIYVVALSPGATMAHALHDGLHFTVAVTVNT